MKCKVITPDKKKCSKEANESGYCTIHEKANERKKKQIHYNEALDAILRVCKTKGWNAYLRTTDSDFQFATIDISKYFDSAHVTGAINVTLDGGVKYSIEKTSFYGYGQSDLLDSISVKLGELSWIEKKKDKDKKALPPEPSFVVLRVLENFDKVVRQLRRRYKERPPFSVTDEYDVQDILHALLRGYFDDVRPEEYTPSYAGSASRVDFLLKNEGVVIEVKYATEKLKEKKIGEQLIIDIKRYQTHPDCKSLYCLVYDPIGHIHNPAGLEGDLSGKHDSLQVKVLVVPH